jgi:hypothetical protein
MGKFLKIHYKEFDDKLYTLPIAGQDLPLASIVCFDDETEDGIPLTWLTNNNLLRPEQGMCRAAKAGEPVMVFAQGTGTPGPEAGYIYVVEKIRKSGSKLN